MSNAILLEVEHPSYPRSHTVQSLAAEFCGLSLPDPDQKALEIYEAALLRMHAQIDAGAFVGLAGSHPAYDFPTFFLRYRFEGALYDHVFECAYEVKSLINWKDKYPAYVPGDSLQVKRGVRLPNFKSNEMLVAYMGVIKIQKG